MAEITRIAKDRCVGPMVAKAGEFIVRHDNGIMEVMTAAEVERLMEKKELPAPPACGS